MDSVLKLDRPPGSAAVEEGQVVAPPRWREFYGLKAESQRFLPAFDDAEGHRVRMVKRVLGRRPASVLDVGYGDGYWCHVLKDELNVDRVEGIDLAPAYVARARGLFPAVPFLEGDVYALPFGASSFEVVTAVEVLEHLDQPGRAMRELARVAARRVVVTVPFNEPLNQRLSPHCLRTFYLDGHIQRFDRERLAALAADGARGSRSCSVNTGVGAGVS